MMTPILETIAQSINYGELPETWCVPARERFSAHKTLYDYQTNALENAARALYLYYGDDKHSGEHGGKYDWHVTELPGTNDARKKYFAERYKHHDDPLANFSVKQYENKADEKNLKQNPLFRIISDFIAPQTDVASQRNTIPYYHFINRMCFWMATGSGKTLVMVKLIEYLHALMRHGEIPSHNILILAPSEHLLSQIRRTVGEFNQTGLHIDLVPLRAIHKQRQTRLGNTLTVYYHRSDNISDVQKDALTDYRTYENDGKWYILLDEAHKGGKDESKRQAYYAMMARRGFLFNFSATFTDEQDIATTVKKYNLQDFVTNGHGKNIFLNREEYESFSNRGKNNNINDDERRAIVMKSLTTLAFVSRRVVALRTETGLENCYHRPLMLTLVNSVNTDTDKNDLHAFFQILRELASGDIEASAFSEIKKSLCKEWQDVPTLFNKDERVISDADKKPLQKMSLSDLREAIFLSRRKGALQFICGKDKGEIAFQLKNADAPFALIRIGDTTKWRNELLAGYEQTTTLQVRSFFAGLEKSYITILMGSRAFFESWDSNRPNVINFINIGGAGAKKFVVQSVGRGVRIEPLTGQRKRLSHSLAKLSSDAREAMSKVSAQVRPTETLFLFATNRKAMKSVLESLNDDSKEPQDFATLTGFEKTERAKVHGRPMPLLVPAYRQKQNGESKHAFAMSEETKQRLTAYLVHTSDSVFAVRDGLSSPAINRLRNLTSVENDDGITVLLNKNYANVYFLQERLMSHIKTKTPLSDAVRPLDGDEDIVHFRHIRVRSEYVNDLQEKISNVKQGRASNSDISRLAKQLEKGQITREEFDKKTSGNTSETLKELAIKTIDQHYYLPVVTASKEKLDYIQHIIKVDSDVKFINALEEYLRKNAGATAWDAWMFSKLDESLDKVCIPYYDTERNAYRNFFPDFIFWMCRGDEYRIVFVDPKGSVHEPLHKTHGYRKLFFIDDVARIFNHDELKVSVHLKFYNTKGEHLAYQEHWINSPDDIFKSYVEATGANQ